MSDDLITAKDPSPIRLAGSLALGGLVSGLALVGVYLATLPRIEQNDAEALQRAIIHVLPGAERITTYVLEGGALVEPPDGDAAGEDVVYAGVDADGRLVGHAVQAEGPGFQDTIRLIYGFDRTRRVIIGMEVLESRETPGLGDKILKDTHFLENFAALAVEPAIEPVKNGERSAPNEVDCITGATISSKAIVAILNGSMGRWLSVLTQEAP